MTDTGTTVATTRDRPPIFVLRERLESRRDELAKSLPPDISPDRFIRAVVTSAQINPDIQACSWQSMWLACLRACRDGLLPDGVEGAIVPYKSTATWIAMYQGLLRNFRRSGQFHWITANVVREGEPFEHFIAETGEHLRHVPGDNFEAPIQRIYAAALTKDTASFIAVMSIAEANKIKAMSKTTREDAPWKMWPSEMYKKTALRRLAKLLPTVRDLLGEEDFPIPEAPSLQPFTPHEEPAARAAIPERTTGRAAGAASALNAFAGSDTDEIKQEPKQEQPQPQPTPEAQQAFDQGRAARAAGLQRKAVPGEYREASASALAAAWVRGWDSGGAEGGNRAEENR